MIAYKNIEETFARQQTDSIWIYTEFNLATSFGIKGNISHCGAPAKGGLHLFSPRLFQTASNLSYNMKLVFGHILVKWKKVQSVLDGREEIASYSKGSYKLVMKGKFQIYATFVKCQTFHVALFWQVGKFIIIYDISFACNVASVMIYGS